MTNRGSEHLLARPAIDASQLPAELESSDIAIEELTFLGMVRVQVSRQNSSVQLSVREALNCKLPASGYFSHCGDWRIQWLTPDEWVVTTPAGQEAQVCSSLAHLQALATVISDSRVTVAVSGCDAAKLIAQGCALDLHDRVFPIGRGTVTRFARIAAMISRTHDAQYEITTDRAHANYFWCWLNDAIKGL